MKKKLVAGKIITFYSYKGGTGRSMALANIACLLSQREKDINVLMIDWDLEAPGLHRYFQNRLATNTFSPFENQLGLIDLFIELKLYCENNKLDGDDMPDDIFESINIEKNLLQTSIHSLHLMIAGKLDKNYPSRVAGFDWNDFFTKYPSLIFKLAEHLSNKFDYVLIDSRTGHTDISGICTTLMPDRLVVVFTPNNQSLSGVLEITKNAIEYRKQSDDLRQLVVFPLVSRVEPAEPNLREEWRFGSKSKKIDGYQPQFQNIFKDIYRLSQCDLTNYFDEVQLQYVPRYAYGEEIAVLSERSEDRLSLARSYENFTERLVNQIRPWNSVEDQASSIVIEAPLKKDEKTQKQDQQINNRALRTEKTVFICYRRTNFYTALAIYQDLTAHGYDVFFDYQSIDSNNFASTILDNINSRAHFIAVLSSSALERCSQPGDWFRREIETAIDLKRNIIPLMMEGFDFGSTSVTHALTGKLSTLNTYNGLRIYADYFFDAMEKLRNRFLSVPISDITTRPYDRNIKKFVKKQNAKLDKTSPVKLNQLIAQEWFEKGYVASSTSKNYLEAESNYRKAIELNPFEVTAYLNLGNLLSELKRLAEAEAAYRKAIEIDPNFAEAYSNLGNLLSEMKRYEEAEAAYRKALELHPSYAIAYSNIGSLLNYLKRYDEAEEAYRHAIGIDPANITAYSNLGSLLTNRKRYIEAEAAYRKAIEVDPADITTYSNLGILLNILERYEEAEAAFRKAIEINPSDVDSYYNLACLKGILGDANSALEYLEKAIAKGFDRAWAKQDPDLENIRNDPRFKELVGE